MLSKTRIKSIESDARSKRKTRRQNTLRRLQDEASMRKKMSKLKRVNAMMTRKGRSKSMKRNSGVRKWLSNTMNAIKSRIGPIKIRPNGGGTKKHKKKHKKKRNKTHKQKTKSSVSTRK